jgi:hypothetical protein
MTKSITNNARGPRVVNAYVGKSERIEPVTLRPGETREDIQLLEDDPVTQGMIDSRELVLGDAKAAAKVRADAAEEGDDALFANDPTFLARREAAMAAGAQPGLADQLSEGKGGKPGAPGCANCHFRSRCSGRCDFCRTSTKARGASCKEVTRGICCTWNRGSIRSLS